MKIKVAEQSHPIIYKPVIRFASKLSDWFLSDWNNFFLVLDFILRNNFDFDSKEVIPLVQVVKFI